MKRLYQRLLLLMFILLMLYLTYPEACIGTHALKGSQATLCRD